MNVGDSRAIVAHYEPKEVDSSVELGSKRGVESGAQSIVEVPLGLGQIGSAQQKRLVALQLSTDHSTSIEEVSLILKLLTFRRNEILSSFYTAVEFGCFISSGS